MYQLSWNYSDFLALKVLQESNFLFIFYSSYSLFLFFFSWQVDMPVFFYIDPEFTEDPAMAKVDTITLSYTFFEAKEAEKLGL